MDDYEVDAEQLGVATALERTCALEARLRQALQDTHVVSRDYEQDVDAADREHDALLSLKDQLELLEDKLREYRALNSQQYEEKTVVLSQLDSLRRELITIARDSYAAVTFAKASLKVVADDIVREVQAFAEMRDEDDFTSEDSDSESEVTYDFDEDGSVISSSADRTSPDRVQHSHSQLHSGTIHALEGSMSGDSPRSQKEDLAWAERGHNTPAASPVHPAAAKPLEPACRTSGPRSGRSGNAASYAPAQARREPPQYRREPQEYRPAADRILSGRAPADPSAYASVADRIMLGGMPGSPEPQPYGGRGGKEGGKDGNKEGHLRLGGSPPALAPQRSPSVQAPVTPSSPEVARPPNSRATGQTGASPGGGWAARVRDMWRGMPAHPVPHAREDEAESDGSAAADDPRFGGKLNVQGLAAKPAQASPRRAPPQMPHVQDTSAGNNSRRPEDAHSAAAAQRGARSSGSGEGGGRPRRLHGALAAVASAVMGAAAVVVIQGQDVCGRRDGRSAPNAAASQHIGNQTAMEQKRGQRKSYVVPLPDVNLGRG